MPEQVLMPRLVMTRAELQNIASYCDRANDLSPELLERMRSLLAKMWSLVDQIEGISGIIASARRRAEAESA